MGIGGSLRVSYGRGPSGLFGLLDPVQLALVRPAAPGERGAGELEVRIGLMGGLRKLGSSPKSLCRELQYCLEARKELYKEASKHRPNPLTPVYGVRIMSPASAGGGIKS